MRILHFYKTAFPDTMGGVEQVINQLARGASKLGIHSDVLSLTASHDGPATIEMDGYRTHRARQNLEIASTGFSASAFFRFTSLARQADMIHYHFPWPFMDLVHFASRIKKPALVTYHSDIVRQQSLLKIYQPLKARFLASMDRIVATSPNYAASSDVLEKHADHLSVIPIGLDRASYPEPTPERIDHWRQKLGPRFFLFVGVLRYYKGLHILIEAAKNTCFPVVIVGAGPVEAELKAQAARLGVSNVHFLGHLPDEDKVALLKLSYGIVFPSHLRSEAFGISLLEGAMFGKPMISSEIGTGTTFINIKGETGLVIPPSDPIALRQAMCYLWERPDVAADMGKRAEARYWQHFTAERMVNAYAELYDQLLTRPKRKVA